MCYEFDPYWLQRAEAQKRTARTHKQEEAQKQQERAAREHKPAPGGVKDPQPVPV